MQAAHTVGRTAHVRKYDLITALGVAALAGDKSDQRRALRFITLLTARYNWITDGLSIGRTEVARLWHVSERTAKREMSGLRAAGWLTVKRPSARGRVAIYGVSVEKVLSDTRAIWAVVGPDFLARMTDSPSTDAGNVVPFRPFPMAAVAAVAPATDRWAGVKARLEANNPGSCSAWFDKLGEGDAQGGQAVLLAPSRFVADYVRTHLMGPLRAAYAAVDPSVDALTVIVAPKHAW